MIHDYLKGQIVQWMIFVLILVILGVAVAIPIIIELLASAGITGISGTILGFIPMFIAIVVVVYIFGGG